MVAKNAKKVNGAAKAKKRKAALAGVYAWKEHVCAVLEAIESSAADLKNEMTRPNSPLKDCMPLWAVRELHMGIGAALTGMCNLNIASELPVDMPDPLAGLYPSDTRDYKERRFAEEGE